MVALKTPFLSSYGFPSSVVVLGFNAKSHLYITQHGKFSVKRVFKRGQPLPSWKRRKRGGEVMDTEPKGSHQAAQARHFKLTRTKGGNKCNSKGKCCRMEAEAGAEE